MKDRRLQPAAADATHLAEELHRLEAAAESRPELSAALAAYARFAPYAPPRPLVPFSTEPSDGGNARPRWRSGGGPAARMRR
jgi:hypothetical protein